MCCTTVPLVSIEPSGTFELIPSNLYIRKSSSEILGVQDRFSNWFQQRRFNFFRPILQQVTTVLRGASCFWAHISWPTRFLGFLWLSFHYWTPLLRKNTKCLVISYSFVPFSRALLGPLLIQFRELASLQPTSTNGPARLVCELLFLSLFCHIPNT